MGADVNTTRRLIKDQELRPGQQPARQQYLLLIAAREKFNGLFRAGRADTELANKAFRYRQLFFAGNGPQPAALRL